MEIPKHPLEGTGFKHHMTNEDGSVKVPGFALFEQSFEGIASAMEKYKWRDEDFLLATYPKNGTHFMWEIMMMLIRNSADNITDSKEICMIDLFPVTHIDLLFPSPRVLNTHYRLDVLPAAFQRRKTIIVIRNPKDVCISYYHHETRLMTMVAGGAFAIKDFTLSDYIKMFLYNKEVPCGSYFDYIEHMWSLRNNSNILIVFFEDLKQEPMATIRKVNKFMGTNRPSELVEAIAKATNFKKMREMKLSTDISEDFVNLMHSSEEQMKVGMSHLFRKGEVGDWKRHFTVADNEIFDSFLDNWKVGQEIPFKYS